MKTELILSESTVRSRAARKGLKVQKARSTWGNCFGLNSAYRVIDLSTNMCVLGGDGNGYGCSLDECAEFVANS